MSIIRLLIITYLLSITPLWGYESPYNIWDNSSLETLLSQTIEDDPEGIITKNLIQYFNDKKTIDEISAYRIKDALKYYLMKYKGGNPYFINILANIQPQKIVMTITYQGQKSSQKDQMAYVVDKNSVMSKQVWVETEVNTPRAIRKSITNLFKENSNINSSLELIMQNENDQINIAAAKTKIEFYLKQYEKRIKLHYLTGLNMDIKDDEITLTINYEVTETGLNDQVVYTVNAEDAAQKIISYTPSKPESAHVIRADIINTLNKGNNSQLINLLSSFLETKSQSQLSTLQNTINDLLHSDIKTAEVIDLQIKPSQDSIILFIKYKINHSTAEDQGTYRIAKDEYIWKAIDE